jgi:hypothetical protein
LLSVNRQTLRPALPAILIAGSAILLAVSPSAFAGQQRPQRPPMKFKNLKVLKNVPPDQIIPIMHKINDSLGVRCDFCHVIKPDHTGFELDTKPEKQTARKMIVMTQKLNKSEKILAGKATCFMCHHGHAMPDVNAPQSPQPPRPGGGGR